jgi:hypothetical protein
MRLDNIQLPQRLRLWHCVDYFPKNKMDLVYQRLRASLKQRAPWLIDSKEEQFIIASKWFQGNRKKALKSLICQDKSWTRSSSLNVI